MRSVCNDPSILRLQFALPADAVGAFWKRDGIMLVVLDPRARLIDPDVAHIEAVGDVVREAIVAEHCDPVIDRMPVSGHLALECDCFWKEPIGAEALAILIHEAWRSRGGPLQAKRSAPGRRLEFGDPLAAAVLGDNHALGKRRGEDRGEVARALGPAARIAGCSGAEPRRQRDRDIRRGRPRGGAGTMSDDPSKPGYKVGYRQPPEGK